MHEFMPARFVTWDEVYDLCRMLAQRLRTERVKVDLIVAIARGGYIPGRLLSDMLGIDDLTGFKIEHYHSLHKRRDAFVKYPLNTDLSGRNVLLVDDVCDSGETFAVGIEHIYRKGAADAVMTAALHLKTVSSFIPDYFAEKVDEWRWLIYPWAVNEDLSGMLSSLPCGLQDRALLQRLIKERHGIDVTCRQIEDALALL